MDAERRAGIREEVDEEEESAVPKGSQSSGTNRFTIGNTFIPQDEREKIRTEVQAMMRQTFPGIQMSTVHKNEFGKSAAPSTNVENPGWNSVPIAIAGSEVSVASTQSNVEAGETKILSPG